MIKKLNKDSIESLEDKIKEVEGQILKKEYQIDTYLDRIEELKLQRAINRDPRIDNISISKDNRLALLRMSKGIKYKLTKNSETLGNS